MITRDIQQLQVVPAFVHAARFHTYLPTGSPRSAARRRVERDRIERVPPRVHHRPARVVTELQLAHGRSAGLGRLRDHRALASSGRACPSGSWTPAHQAGPSRPIQRPTGWFRADSGRRPRRPALGQHLLGRPARRGAPSAIGIGAVLDSTTSTERGRDDPLADHFDRLLLLRRPWRVVQPPGAKRFVRVVIRPHLETTGCGAGTLDVRAAAIFGEPDEAVAHRAGEADSRNLRLRHRWRRGPCRRPSLPAGSGLGRLSQEGLAHAPHPGRGCGDPPGLEWVLPVLTAAAGPQRSPR